MQALAVWLGLREVAAALTHESKREIPAPPATLQPSPPTTPSGPVATAPRTALDEELRLRDLVAMAFAPQKDAYVKQCFRFERDRPQGFAFEFGIDAAGNETRRSVRSLPGGAPPQPALDTCVQSFKAPRLKIEPPGKPIATRIDVALP